MEIIDDLEPVKRGPYAGVVGYIDFSGTIDTAIAIRTLVVRRRRLGPRPGGRRRGRRQRARARGPRVPQQGPRPARRGARRPADDRPAPVARWWFGRPFLRDCPHGRARRRAGEPTRSRAFEALEGDGAARRHLARDLLAVEGPDAGRYLQGQLSQDVVALAGRLGVVAAARAGREGRRLDPGAPPGRRRVPDRRRRRPRRGGGRPVAALPAAHRPPRCPTRARSGRSPFAEAGPVVAAEVPDGWLRGIVAGPGVAGVDLLDEPGSGWEPPGWRPSPAPTPSSATGSPTACPPWAPS